MEKKGKENVEPTKVIKVRIRKSKPEPAPSTPPSTALFEKAEVRRFVTEFISAWIRGDITIRFPTASELAKKNPLAITFPMDPSINEELKIKEHYIDLLMTCAGIKQVSACEQEQAVTDVFRMLLMFRSANRIEGKILSGDFDKRVAALEEKAQSTAKLLEQITGFLFKEKKASD